MKRPGLVAGSLKTLNAVTELALNTAFKTPSLWQGLDEDLPLRQAEEASCVKIYARTCTKANFARAKFFIRKMGWPPLPAAELEVKESRRGGVCTQGQYRR